MYSRSYSKSNHVPPNYSGTSIEVDKQELNNSDETSDEINDVDVDVFANQPYARVPLMDVTEYTSENAKDKSVFKQSDSEMIHDENVDVMKKGGIGKPFKTDKDFFITNKKISSDDILLIGILIVLLGCENVDIKLIIAIGILLFVGL